MSNKVVWNITVMRDLHVSPAEVATPCESCLQKGVAVCKEIHRYKSLTSFEFSFLDLVIKIALDVLKKVLIRHLRRRD